MSPDMSHLTDDQLSARLDEALPAAASAQADAHLAQCEACRARLAELGANDAALATALTHDPGEAYFESFADRVAARIAADAAAAPAPVPTRPSGFWGWFATPRRIAAIGGTLAFVVAAGWTWQLMQRGPAPPVALEARIPEPSASSAPATEAAPQVQESSDREAPATPAPARTRSGSDSRAMADAAPRAAAPGAPPAVAAGRSATTGRMQEMRAVEGGEAVPVPRESDRLLARDRADAPATAPAPTADAQRQAITELKRRAVASPLARTDPPAQSKETAQSQTDARRELSAKVAAPRAANALAAPSAPAPGAIRAFDEDASSRASEDGSEWCGVVRDAAGRAIAGATVTVPETGRIARTDTTGRFCLPAAGRDATLQVLAVGFEPQRLLMRGKGGVQPLSISLKAVPALGDGMAVPRDAAMRGAGALDVAPAARWDSVATRADDSLSRARGSASRLAAMRTAADARLRAWRAQPTRAREAIARAAIDRYLAELPEGPRRAEAQRWRDALPR